MLSGKIKKAIAITLAVTAFFQLALFAVAYSRKRAAELRTRDWIVAVLEERFQSGVELADFHVNVLPKMSVSGKGLSIRYRNRPEAAPMIRVEQFSFDLGFWSIFRAPYKINRIHLQRMVIVVPPKQPANGNASSVPAIPFKKLSKVTAREIDCDNAELLIFP